MRNIPLDGQTNSYFLSFGQGVYIFDRNPRSIQGVIGDVYCPGKYCFNREKCESFEGYLRTPRSIYGCGNCGAWFFVDKVPFMLPEHVRTTKTDKTRFFFVKKRCTCYATNNFSLKSHFNQWNKGRKKCVWSTKYKRQLEICIVQHLEMKSVFTLQPIKPLVSTTVKSAKPAAAIWVFLLRTKNSQLCCLAVMVYIALQERRMVVTKKKSPLHFWQNFATNHNRARPNLSQKGKNHSFYGIFLSTPHWLIQLTKTIIYIVFLYIFSLQ